MTTPARLLYEGAGSPPSPKPAAAYDGPCYWCGLPCDGLGVPVAKVCNSMFSDHHLASSPEATHVCVPCTWAMAGKGSDTLRTWSIVYREDQPPYPNHEKSNPARHSRNACLCARNDMTPVLDALLEPPDGRWFVSIAEKGKIHTLPHARVNHSQAWWLVRFERFDVTSTPQTFARLLHHQAQLYQTGFVKEDIRIGEPHPSKLVKYGIDLWHHHNTVLSPDRHSPAFQLALFLLKKDGIEDVIERTAHAAEPRSGDGPGSASRARRDAIGVDREDRPTGLVDPGEGCARLRDGNAGLRDVRSRNGREPADPHPQGGVSQGNLFDWAGTQ